MQDDSGLRAILKLPAVYDLYQIIIGGNRPRKDFLLNHVCPKPGEKLVDIGCGPAHQLEWMPRGVRYVGIDISPDYIKAAQKKYGDRGVFMAGTTKTIDPYNLDIANADVVMVNGVLHHLDDDEALHLIAFAHSILKKGDKENPGRFLAAEGAYLPGQSRISKWILDQDRGKNVRTEEGYSGLAAKHFPRIEIVRQWNALRIPYTAIIMKCLK